MEDDWYYKRTNKQRNYWGTHLKIDDWYYKRTNASCSGQGQRTGNGTVVKMG